MCPLFTVSVVHYKIRVRAFLSPFPAAVFVKAFLSDYSSLHFNNIVRSLPLNDDELSIHGTVVPRRKSINGLLPRGSTCSFV